MLQGADASELELLHRLRSRLLGVGQSKLGRYRFVRLLGAGGMGEVWLAEDPRLGRQVALKLLLARNRKDTGGRARLLREAQAIAKITHPNVVAVFDTGVIEAKPGEPPQAFIAMEYVEGTALDVWLKARPRSVAEIVDVFTRAGRGLAAAHAAAQIHRDFKPANVMVTPAGEAKVLDFGLVLDDSRISSEADPGDDSGGLGDSERLTETGVVMGTPRYMAPEQHTDGVVTPASDQFAFCCALLEALQGMPAFVGRNHVELGIAKRRGRVIHANAPHLPSWLRAVVERGLAPSPSQRWPSMNELLLRLQGERRRGRGPTLLAAGVGLLALAAFAVPGRDQCDRSTTWTNERGAALTERLRADGPTHDAGAIVGRVATYAEQLAGSELASCEAHRRGAVDDEAFDRRAACLQDRHLEFAAAVAVLEREDTPIDRAHAVVARLAPVESCVDDAQLATALAPPTDAPTLRAVEHARGRRALARALDTAGKRDEALAILEDTRRELEGIDFPPVHAEIAVDIGTLLGDRGDSAAVAALEDALLQAQACGHDGVAAKAVSVLIHLLSRHPGKHDRVRALIALGEALVVRAGDAPRDRARYWSAVGGFHLQRSEYEQCLEAHERAHAAYGKSDDEAEVSVARANIGTCLNGLGRFEEALAHHLAALEVRERVLGPRHPRTIRALLILGAGREDADRPDEAVPYYSDAVERAELGLGPTASELMTALGSLARVSRATGRFDEARTAYLRALAIAEARGEPRTADTALLLSNLGNLERQTDRLDEARAHLEQALEIREAVLDPGHFFISQSRVTLASVENLAGNYDRGRSLASSAADGFRSAPGTKPAYVSLAECRVAGGLLGLGRVADARRHVDLAGAASTAADTPYRITLGRVLIAERNPAAALVQLEQALADADDATDRGLALVYTAEAERARGDAIAMRAALTRARTELEAAGPAGRHGLREWSRVDAAGT